MGGKSSRYISLCKASLDKPSPTITKSVGVASMASVVHPLECRKYSLGEAKRASSFPDEFRFHGSWGDSLSRIGNSVPPLFMYCIARNIRSMLETNMPYSTIDKNDYLSLLSASWQKHLAQRDLDAPTVISTFAGCGGSSLGYSMAGFRELLAVEWDDNAVATFRLNFPDVPVYHGDIARLDVDEVLHRAKLEPGELDVFDGSPPCQGFSTAGKRDFGDDRNQLFREYVRLLRGLRPKIFVMENVSGMVKGKMKLIFAEILKELKASGYRVSARLLNAKYFHVPQSRERMIFIGVRSDLSIEPSHPKAEGSPIGSIRMDARPARYSDRRYGDTLEKEGLPIGTITKIGRKFWSRSQEFGPLSYSVNTSFPIEFQFVGGIQDRKARIGNCVPPLLVEAVGRHIRQEMLSKTCCDNYM